MHNIIKERMNLFFSEETSASFLLHNHKRVSDLTFLWSSCLSYVRGIVTFTIVYRNQRRACPCQKRSGKVGR